MGPLRSSIWMEVPPVESTAPRYAIGEQVIPHGVFGALLLDKGVFPHPFLRFAKSLEVVGLASPPVGLPLVQFHQVGEYEGCVRVLVSSEVSLSGIGQHMGSKDGITLGIYLLEDPNLNFPVYSGRRCSMCCASLRPPNGSPGSLWKHYSHYRKSRGKVVQEINSPEFRRNMTTIAKELTKMERTAFEEDYLFGASPVIYRDARRVKVKELPNE